MDFTPELSAFQGVLISADNVHSFSRLISKGGESVYLFNNIYKATIHMGKFSSYLCTNK